MVEAGGALTALSQKDTMGSKSFEVEELVKAADMNWTLDKHILGYFRRRCTMEDGDGVVVEVEMQFVPHF